MQIYYGRSKMSIRVEKETKLLTFPLKMPVHVASHVLHNKHVIFKLIRARKC
jgi:hypothetical protein